MIKYTFSELNPSLLAQYKKIVRASFPDIIFESEVVKHSWDKIETYFPEYQIFYVDEEGNLIGFINAIPFYWNQPLDDLPDEGWDWEVKIGIEGYENNIKPNCIGGLQIIVAKEHLGQGYSKLLIEEGKRIKEKLGFKNFLLPIRPTFKSKFPEMDMTDYINLKEDNKIYDPWIRTHLSGGAKIIKICSKAMHIYGNLPVWERLLNQKISESGNYLVKGALNPVEIDIEKDYGEYFEDNIWIKY
jgi:GNAT superfamily N-acetyltransferase